MSRKYKKRVSVQVSTPRVKALAKKPPKWKHETIILGNIRYRKRPYKCQYDDCIFP